MVDWPPPRVESERLLGTSHNNNNTSSNVMAMEKRNLAIFPVCRRRCLHRRSDPDWKRLVLMLISLIYCYDGIYSMNRSRRLWGCILVSGWVQAARPASAPVHRSSKIRSTRLGSRSGISSTSPTTVRRVVSIYQPQGRRLPPVTLWDDDDPVDDNDLGVDGDKGKYLVLVQNSDSSTPAPRSALLERLRQQFRSTFLPAGTLPDGYIPFVLWSCLQDLSTQLRGVLATQRILEGVGVGRPGATTLSALMNFLVRDGCGMAATLVFTRAAAARFQSDIKRWRLLADIMVDIGITLEMAATLVPPVFFLPMISAGNMAKAICGVAAGATGGAIHVHWATACPQSNLAETHAKFGAQHTLTASGGLLVSAFLARSLTAGTPNSPTSWWPLWILHAALTVLHILANRKCMRSMAMESLNRVRFPLLLRHYWEGSPGSSPVTSSATPTPPSVLTPRQMATKEPLLFGPWTTYASLERRVAPLPIHLGVSFEQLQSWSGQSKREWARTLVQASSAPYYWVSRGRRPAPTAEASADQPCILVALGPEATPYHQARAYFEAIWYSRHYGAAPSQEGPPPTFEKVDLAWQEFAQHCQKAGWNLNATHLPTQGYLIELN